MDIVCTVEAATATEWQLDLLAYSMTRVGERSPLHVISAGGLPASDAGDTVTVTRQYRHADGGDYAPLNRPYGLAEWLEGSPATDDTLLLFDPDIVLLAQLPAWTATPGAPCAQAFPRDVAIQLGQSYTRALTANPDLLVAVGVPVLLTRSDLEVLVPHWIAQTEAVRRAALPGSRWIAELLALELAFADLGWTVTPIDVACGPLLFHYYTGNCGLRWRKGSYRPWDPLPPIDPGAPAVVRAFAALLSEYGGLRRSDSARGPVGAPSRTAASRRR